MSRLTQTEQGEGFHSYSLCANDKLKHLSTRLSVMIKHCPELKGWTPVLYERNETWQRHSGQHNRFSSLCLSWLIMSRKQAWLGLLDFFFYPSSKEKLFPHCLFAKSCNSVGLHEDTDARLDSSGPLGPIGSHSGT